MLQRLAAVTLAKLGSVRLGRSPPTALLKIPVWLCDCASFPPLKTDTHFFFSSVCLSGEELAAEQYAHLDSKAPSHSEVEKDRHSG